MYIQKFINQLQSITLSAFVIYVWSIGIGPVMPYIYLELIQQTDESTKSVPRGPRGPKKDSNSY